MSKKETIENRVKALSEREEKIKLQLDNDSDEMKDKAMRIGKIALIAGGVALLGYWIFNMIFREEEEEEEDRPKKKRKRDSDGISSKVTAFILPYIGKILDGLLDGEEEPKKKKELEESEED
ncbi:MAG: hypothetical protein RLN88_01215 [Ekhidna sp.]|uniref:hypothetical protein n=1 Tax=Ekhidna sp. TaxID=2608089 RepID=UPI0032EB4F48